MALFRATSWICGWHQDSTRANEHRGGLGLIPVCGVKAGVDMNDRLEHAPISPAFVRTTA